MKNRKLELTLITLRSGAKLILWVTGKKNDRMCWTNFIDADNSEPEYDNPIWSKDEMTSNPEACMAFAGMVDAEVSFEEGGDKEKCLADFKTSYEKWVTAHKAKNPGFIARQIKGLTM